MRTKTAWKVFFAAAGLWNILAGAPLLLTPNFIVPFMWLYKSPSPEQNVFVQFSGVCIALFGFGYAMAGWYPHEWLSVLLLGVIGKIYVFCSFLWYWHHGMAKPQLVMAGSVDFLFALAFIYNLSKYGNTRRSVTAGVKVREE
jgi:hypothetical protein